MAYHSIKAEKQTEFVEIAREMYRFDKTDIFECMVDDYELLDDVWKRVVDGLFEASEDFLPWILVDSHTERKYLIKREDLVGIAIAAHLIHNR